jgi:16S rRNA processing protein RimM
VVGRIIRPHGLRGELSVEVRTDDPDRRYANGSVLGTEPPQAGPLTVTASRWHSGRLLVSFAEVVDRTDAELLRGVLLTVDAAEVPLPHDPDEFHDHQLTGLTVVTVSGELVGTVSDVLHYGQDLLSVTPAAGTSRQEEVLVPFVAAIAVEVDLAAGKVVIDPPPGLLDLATGDVGSASGDAHPDGGDAEPGTSDAGSDGAKATSAEVPGAEAPGAKATGAKDDGGEAGSNAAGPYPGGHGED